jgi:ribulose-5-phosphate 4-epimerase/fuculose-1-phosphate aldolase
MAVTALNVPTQSGVKEQVSPEEWQCRVDLAALYRLVAMEGMTDLAATHISARVPGPEDHFLINPYGLMYEEVTASNLVKVDINSEKVKESPFPVNPAGFTIHSAVHMARPDVQCVVHTHTPAGMAFASVETEILPLSQTAMQFWGRTGYHAWEGISTNLDERERIVRDLGTHRALILHNHGLLVAAPTIPAAWVLIYQLERVCRTQLAAMAAAKASGQPITVMSDEVAEKTAAGSDQSMRNAAEGRTDFDWPAHLAALDAVDDSYRH